MSNQEPATDSGTPDWEVKVKAALDMVSALCLQKRRWIMSIPARPDYDPDLVIAEGLRAARDEARRLQALREPRPAPEAIETYFVRQADWSERTFGSGTRTLGIVEHIRKELGEVIANPHDLEEWIDIVMLAMDGFWRHGGDPRTILEHLNAKQAKNFARQWQTPQDNHAVEHVREPRPACPVTAQDLRAMAEEIGKRCDQALTQSAERGPCVVCGQDMAKLRQLADWLEAEPRPSLNATRVVISREQSWLPIETAPKGDGYIDLWLSSADGVDQWRETHCWWNGDRRLWANHRGMWDCATHWMPEPGRPGKEALLNATRVVISREQLFDLATCFKDYSNDPVAGLVCE